MPAARGVGSAAAAPCGVRRGPAWRASRVARAARPQRGHPRVRDQPAAAADARAITATRRGSTRRATAADWSTAIACALDVDVGAGAAAFVSTQASTKVYRSPRGTERRLTRARRRRTRLLVAGARSRGLLRRRRGTGRCSGSTLAADGGAGRWSTGCRPGRRASGERWAFDEYAACIDGRVGERAARARRAGAAGRRRRSGRAARPVRRAGGRRWSSGGRCATRRRRDRRRRAIGDRPLARRADQLVAGAAARRGGCVVRMAGTSVEQVGRTLRELARVRPAAARRRSVGAQMVRPRHDPCI